MTQSDYLLISRGQWDESASPRDVQDAIDRFYAWYERGLADGVLKPGSRLEMRGKRVTRDGITDGPFAEAKELVGGYWFIVADSLEDAARQLRGIAMTARVRRRAHPVVEDAFGRNALEIERAVRDEPLGIGQIELQEGRAKRLDPGVVLVDDVDAGHGGPCARRGTAAHVLKIRARVATAKEPLALSL